MTRRKKKEEKKASFKISSNQQLNKMAIEDITISPTNMDGLSPLPRELN